MTEAFPRERAAKREFLLDAVDSISKTLRASGARSEESARLAAEAVDALVRTGMFRLKLAAEMGGAEADPITEMLVLEALAYHDLTSGWCTMVGATAIASLGTFLPRTGLEKVFKNGQVPTAAISFFPAGRAVRDGDGYRVNGRWRFNSGIRHGMGARRHGCRRRRGRDRRTADGHVLRLPGQGRHHPRQLGRRGRSQRHGLLRLLGRQLPSTGRSDVR